MIDIKSLRNSGRVYFHNNEIAGSIYAVKDAFIISGETKLPVPNADLIVYIHVYIGNGDNHRAFYEVINASDIAFSVTRNDVSLYSLRQWLMAAGFSKDTCEYIDTAIYELNKSFSDEVSSGVEPTVVEQTQTDVSEDSEVSDNE